VAWVVPVATALSLAPVQGEEKPQREQEAQPALEEKMMEAHEAGNMRTTLDTINAMLARDAFESGLSALHQRDYLLAAQAFKRTLSLNPDHHRARLELARAYTGLEAFAFAEVELQTVLDHHPPPAVKKNIDRFLQRIRILERRWSTSVHVSGGFFYDDNVNVGPDDAEIRIRPIEFLGASIDTLTVSADSRPQEAWGLFGFAEARGVYDIGARGDWAVAAQSRYYQTTLDNASDFELLYVGFMPALQHHGRRHYLEWPLQYERIERGGESLVDFFGTQPAFTHRAGPTDYWTTTGTAQYRDYDELDNRDAVYLEIGESYRHFYSTAAGSSLVLAVAIFYEDADDNAFSNYGLEPRFGFEWPLFGGIRGYLRGKYRGEWYEAREDLADDDRQDNELQAIAGLQFPMGDHYTLDASYQYTRNFSSFDIYDFDRNILTFSVHARF